MSVFCVGNYLISGIVLFYFQAEDGIRYLVRSRGLGDVYKRQARTGRAAPQPARPDAAHGDAAIQGRGDSRARPPACLLYTSDAADERSSVDLGGRRIIKKIDIEITRLYYVISNTYTNQRQPL